ncbi:MAG: Maebl, partial [Anaerolineales bacterium]|nr:Maebl [Anaerolineales bacterium]
GVFFSPMPITKMPKAFVNACDVFVFTENLAVEKKAVRQKQAQQAKRTTGKKQEEGKEELDPMPVLSQAFEMSVGQDGWAPLASMGQAIYQ